MQGATNDTFTSVVGSKTNGSDIRVPVIGHYDRSSGVVTSTQLPLPPGSEGESVGGAVFPNGDRVAIGNIWSGGMIWGVLWRRPLMGIWGMPQRLCEDATESYASRTDYNGESGALLEVAGSDLEGGPVAPGLHRVSMDSVVTVDLPLPQGWNGAALDVDVADEPGEQTTAVGWVEGPNGRMRPVAWIDTGQQMDAQPDLHTEQHLRPGPCRDHQRSRDQGGRRDDAKRSHPGCLPK